MRALPPVEQVLPVFHHSFDAALTQVAKTSFLSAITFPLLGAILAASLLISTRFGNDQEAEEKNIVKYGFAPLAAIGIGSCLIGIVAAATLATSIILDLAHTLVLGRHAMSYRYIFFPYKFNFIDYNALIK